MNVASWWDGMGLGCKDMWNCTMGHSLCADLQTVAGDAGAEESSFNKTSMLPFMIIIIQDHLRWRYSTVIHLEELVHLAEWQDLKKEKRKEQRNKI